MDIKISDFSKLYALYKNQLLNEGADDKYILQENMIAERGESGIYMMLAVLYANHEQSPSLFHLEDWVGERPVDVGMSQEVCSLATNLLKREVQREDKLTLFHIRAEKVEISDEAFDRLTATLNNPEAAPNQALVDLMARKKRWSE